MAVVKSKPTSAGRRHHVRVVHKDLHKGRGYAPLLEKNSKTGGRNNLGRITTRHIGGGHKHHYRVIDFKRTKDGIPAKVERVSTILTALRTLHFCYSPMASAATLLRQRALWRAIHCYQALRHRSKRVTAYRFVIFPSVQ